jgi:hypothetical protein
MNTLKEVDILDRSFGVSDGKVITLEHIGYYLQ